MGSAPRRQMMRLKLVKGLAAGLVMLTAAGCGRRDDTASAQPPEALAAAPAAWTSLAPHGALARIPGRIGQATHVAEQRSEAGRAQEITLATSPGLGRNHIAIAERRGTDSKANGPAKPTEAGIRSELESAFPGRAMHVVRTPRQNAFGPYGLAVATAPGRERCVYAWQWIESGEPRLSGRIDGHASWRARICRTDATLDDIAAALDRLDLGASAPGLPEPHASTAPSRPRTARKPSASPSVAAVTAVPKPSRQDGPHCLAPIAAITAAVQQGAAPARVTALDTSLPAAAYRGPVATIRAVPRPDGPEIPAARALVPAPN